MDTVRIEHVTADQLQAIYALGIPLDLAIITDNHQVIGAVFSHSDGADNTIELVD